MFDACLDCSPFECGQLSKSETVAGQRHEHFFFQSSLTCQIHRPLSLRLPSINSSEVNDDQSITGRHQRRDERFAESISRATSLFARHQHELSEALSTDGASHETR